MSKTLLLALSGALLLALSARAQDTQPTSKPSAAPSADTTKAQLEKSTRHGEWVDIDLPGGGAKLKTWGVSSYADGRVANQKDSIDRLVAERQRVLELAVKHGVTEILDILAPVEEIEPVSEA